MKSRIFFITVFAVVALAACIGGCKQKEQPENKSETLQESTQTGNGDGAILYARPVLFAGNDGSGEGIYLLEAGSGKSILLSDFGKETILAIEYVKDSLVAVLSAEKAEKRGVFPIQEKVTLSMVNTKGEKRAVKRYPVFLQSKLVHLEQGSLALIANRFASGSDTKVEQITVLLSESGEVLNETKKTFDITAEGFPQLPKDNIVTVSPGGIRVSKNTDNELVIRYAREKFTLGITEQELSAVLFTHNQEYVVIVTRDISPANETLYNEWPETSTLYLFSMKERKTVREYHGGGLKDAVISGRHLIFDAEFGVKSHLIIIDIDPNTELKSSMKKGCGLKAIPKVPDYSA